VRCRLSCTQRTIYIGVRGRGRSVILLVDNYDSFVHNLARYFQRLGHATRIVRNDSTTAQAVHACRPRAVVLSPGPCTPRQAGCSLDIVRRLAGRVPILGVCLGHQAIVEALGGRVIRAPEPMHGRASPVTHDGQGVFTDLPNPLFVGRYHSLVVDRGLLPACFEVSATTDDGLVMAVRHRQHAVIGLQFHPESILTEHGYRVLAGFLRVSGLALPPVPPDGQDERTGHLGLHEHRFAARSLAGLTF